MADLMPTTKPNGNTRDADQVGPRRITKTYDYRDERGELLFQVVRMEPKTFRQRVPKAGGGWSWSVKDVRRVLYRLPELVAADAKKVVFVVEGEKDVDRLVSLGFVATCNPGGAGKWKEEYCEFFRDRPVVILPDNDDVGREHAQAVAKSLTGIAKAVKIVNLPGLLPKADVSDWLDSGGTRDQLAELVKAAPMYRPIPSEGMPPKLQKWGTIEPLGVANVPPFPVAARPVQQKRDATVRRLLDGTRRRRPADRPDKPERRACAAASADDGAGNSADGAGRAVGECRLSRSRATGTFSLFLAGKPHRGAKECRSMRRCATTRR